MNIDTMTPNRQIFDSNDEELNKLIELYVQREQLAWFREQNAKTQGESSNNVRKKGKAPNRIRDYRGVGQDLESQFRNIGLEVLYNQQQLKLLYRVSYSHFVLMAERLAQNELFWTHERDASGREAIALRMKLALALGCLTSGVSLYKMSLKTKVSAAFISNLFDRYLEDISKYFSNDFKPTDDEMRESMTEFDRRGFPGACMIVDVFGVG